MRCVILALALPIYIDFVISCEGQAPRWIRFPSRRRESSVANVFPELSVSLLDRSVFYRLEKG